MHALHRLRRDRRARRLIIPSLIIAVVSLLAAVVVSRTTSAALTPLERAARFAAAGELVAADVWYWEALQTAAAGEELEVLIALIDNRALMLRHDPAGVRWRLLIPDELLRRFLTGGHLAEEPARLARFWYRVRIELGDPELSAVERLADRPRPVRWANHLLARYALFQNDRARAAERFEREGTAFAEATGDLRLALALWADLGDASALRARVESPSFRAVVSPRIRLALARHEGDWASFLFWLWPASFEGVGRWSLLLAAVAAVLWFSLAARMGRIGDDVRARIWLYFGAFILGLVSIYPTLIAITLQEDLLGLRMLGEPIPDIIFFVFGVGLREELFKLLLFLPLLPLLLRRGSRIEALACGALVGLGFAAEENVGYFERYDAGVAIARFLTANFLHMALTALVAVAAFDSLRGKARPAEGFSTIFPLAVLIHGAYDFFLSSPQMADISILAMSIFILVSQRFLREILGGFPAERRAGLLEAFVLSLALLTGLSFVYAAALVGVAGAVPLIATGVAGVAIITIMFVREMSPRP